jgi:flagellar biosynthesis/type III secretory pathway protein FliH
LDRASAEVINVVTGLDFKFTVEGGKVDVCKAIEQIKETAMAEGERKGFAQGEKQGFAQGEKQGFAQGEKQGFDRGDKHGEEKGILNSIRNLMETMSWTAQAAMDALKIPEADRADYLAKL